MNFLTTLLGKASSLADTGRQAVKDHSGWLALSAIIASLTTGAVNWHIANLHHAETMKQLESAQRQITENRDVLDYLHGKNIVSKVEKAKEQSQ